MSKRPRSSSMWSYFKIVDGKEKVAKCDMCGLNMSFRSTTTNLKSHITKKHPTVSLSTLPVIPSNERAIQSVSANSASGSIDLEVQPSTSSSISLSHNLEKQPTQPLNTNLPNQPSHHHQPSVSVPAPRQSQMGSFVARKVTNTQKRKLDKSLLRLFTTDYQPFSVVEDSGFRNFVRELNPSYVLPTRKTISGSLIPAAYEECKTAVIGKLKDVKQVCLTTDIWSSAAQESYLALTAHFVNDDFTLESILLDCCLIEGSHTSFLIACKIREILDNLDIDESKVLIAISDNGSNVKGAITNVLKWSHFGCYGHTLNLIVDNALSSTVEVASLILKVRNIVKHFKRSNQDQEKFLKYQKDAGIKEPKKLILDVSTRWNSTYYMIERANSLQESVRATLALIDKEIPPLTVEEWKICNELCKALKPFEEVTRRLSGEKYVSGSQIVFLTAGLTDVCQKLLKRPLHCIAIKVTQLLQEGILTRLGNVENNKIIGVCSLLDPRFKLYPFTSSHSQSLIKETIKKLATAEFNAERNESNLNNPTARNEAERENEAAVPDEDAELSVTAFFDDVIRKAQPPGSALSSAIVEVQRYLEERTIDRKEDPLKWWATKQQAYPILAKIVKKRFCMVATSVPCERIFSKTGLIINDRRTRLKSSKVQKLIFLNANNKYWSTV